MVWPGRIDIGLPAILRTVVEEGLDGGWIEVSFDESEMAEREADEDEEGQDMDQDMDPSDGGPSIDLRTKAIRHKRRSLSQQIPFPLPVESLPSSNSSVPGSYTTPKSPLGQLRYQPDSLKNFNRPNPNLRYRNSGPVGVGIGMSAPISPAQSYTGRVY